MYPIVLALHVLFCLFVILIVLVQSGKGAGFSGLMGGGSSDAIFNAPSGSMFLRKVTTGLVAAFFVTSLLLTFLAARQHGSSVTQRMVLPEAPAAPAPVEAPADKK
jgi:preprotein translocase subunit SecG